MAEALYHPEFGYYTSHIRTVGGSRGDFATSPTLSALLGFAVARWIESEIAALGLNPPVSIIEVGGGEGSLLHEVIRSIDQASHTWWKPNFSRRHRFHLVEISPRLRERQRETLKRHRRRIQWHDTLESALAAAEGEAVIFSNELVDAFPVIALRRNGETEGRTTDGDPWSEIHLAFEPSAGLAELTLPLSQSRPSLDPSDFSLLREPTDWPDGQRIELHESYRTWWQAWAPRLRRGSLLTIDYGAADAAAIYRRRPGGSLRAYYRHQRLNGPGLYRMFGRQDLTADVCFADLVRWGESFGFQTLIHQAQAEFLRDFAPDACATRSTTDRAAAFLLEPGGAGDAFRVLGQRKGTAVSG